MDETAEPRRVGDRIEHLLDDLKGALDGRSYEAVEELVRQVTNLYGEALGRVVASSRDHAPDLLERLAGDDLVAGLLSVHGLHPHPLEQRVESALESVRPFLAHHDGDVELVAIDPELGAVKLRLLGSCDGCPSSAVTLQHAVERAILEAAPEIVLIDVDDAAPAPVRAGPETPVVLSRKPVFVACPSGLAEPSAAESLARSMVRR